MDFIVKCKLTFMIASIVPYMTISILPFMTLLDNLHIIKISIF